MNTTPYDPDDPAGLRTLPPLRERKFKRMRVVWVNGLLHDINGDFTLQGSSPRGLRLLWRLTKSKEKLEEEFDQLAASLRKTQKPV